MTGSFPWPTAIILRTCWDFRCTTHWHNIRSNLQSWNEIFSTPAWWNWIILSMIFCLMLPIGSSNWLSMSFRFTHLNFNRLSKFRYFYSSISDDCLSELTFSSSIVAGASSLASLNTSPNFDFSMNMGKRNENWQYWRNIQHVGWEIPPNNNALKSG